MCQEKHMGSRAVVLVRRDASGTIHTRTGRPMFSLDVTNALLARLRDTAAGLWDELGTDWLLLDTEVLPWSAKAEDLLRTQYAAVGAAARTSLAAAVALAEQAGVDAGPWRHRLANAEAFTHTYRRYCWPTDGVHGVSVAPFMILASEGRSHLDADHAWHLAHIDRMVAADPEVLRPTRRLTVATDAPLPGVQWWLDLTGAGGEGMVVKPLQPVPGVQPGIKVRGREYLRIIYGPDYLDHLPRLKDRRLGLKRSLALREHSLGREALRRLAGGEPLWRVHEAVFAVLALESEPVDPRL
jgi:protein phosphatase